MFADIKYADVGDKLNFAAYYIKDGTPKFTGWIRKHLVLREGKNAPLKAKIDVGL